MVKAKPAKAEVKAAIWSDTGAEARSQAGAATWAEAGAQSGAEARRLPNGGADVALH